MIKKNMIKAIFTVCLTVLCWMPMNAQNDAGRGDVNLDGNVNIADVTALIDYLLSGNWSGETPSDGIQTFTVGGVSFKMLPVEGGTFTMGDDNYSNGRPAHQVTLSSFCLGETEVTQELWEAVMGSNPSYFTGDLTYPVDQVTWNDCQTFITKLNEMTGKVFRLPTEAEWEYAARGGNKSKGYKYAGSDYIDDVAWYKENSENTTHPVAGKNANELGLYDMSGNVVEWCYDWYSSSYNGEAQTNPTGPDSGQYRVYRGGNWKNDVASMRLTYRGWAVQSAKGNYIGLRLAMSIAL